ncbi:MAG TPA: FtsQ-type POTRA domain-containing protein, partial [Thermoanaerobacterales bacterium]|nr:FtsQ-type POTRA domain-containing protein [Thermoanaerobacterales bacterium]
MKKIKYLTLLFILFLCIIGYIFLNNPFFNISNVIVKGNDLLTRDDIISYSNVKIGTNIFKTNSKDIYKNLMRNPRIKEADMNINSVDGKT